MCERPLYVYVFDENHRIYKKIDGRMLAGPIWSEHWRKEEIVSETSRSWITNRGTKVSKKNPDKRQFLFSEGEVNQASWVHAHKYEISQKVLRLDDYGTLVAVLNILGSEEEI